MYITFTDEYNTSGMNTGKCVFVCIYTHTNTLTFNMCV